MGVRADIRDEVRKETVTKIHGQPTNQDLTILEKELITILANIPTTLGGGNHGHAGIIMDPARYLLTAGVAFTINHIAAVVIPVLFGLIWLISPMWVFLAGSAMALISLILALNIPLSPRAGYEVVWGYFGFRKETNS